MATIGFSKVFILDKYFSELQKFWETEKKLQGMHMQGKNICIIIRYNDRKLLISLPSQHKYIVD